MATKNPQRWKSWQIAAEGAEVSPNQFDEMNTEDQKYKGRGDNALLNERTAQQSVNMAVTADERQLDEYWKDAEEGHLELFRTVEFFCGFRAERNPITVINDTLQDWLLLPTTNLSGSEHHRNQLHALLETVNFLTACQTHIRSISYYEGEIDLLIAKAGKEVRGE